MNEPPEPVLDPARIVADNHNALVVLSGGSAYAPRGGVLRLVGLLDQGPAGTAYILKCPVLRQQEKGLTAQPHLFVPTSCQLSYLRDYLSGPYLAAAESDATAGGAGPEPEPLWLAKPPEDLNVPQAAA